MIYVAKKCGDLFVYDECQFEGWLPSADKLN